VKIGDGETAAGHRVSTPQDFSEVLRTLAAARAGR